MSCSPGWLSMYANASSQRLRVGFRDALVTVSVSAPTAYERVQNMQYVGHTEVAVSSSVPYSAIRGKKKKKKQTRVNLRKNSALSGYRWTRPLTGESASSCSESSTSFGWSGIMTDFIGRNCRTIGSCRGSFQLTRLRMYGLSSVSGQT